MYAAAGAATWASAVTATWASAVTGGAVRGRVAFAAEVSRSGTAPGCGA